MLNERTMLNSLRALYYNWQTLGTQYAQNKDELKQLLLANAINLTALTLIPPFVVIFFALNLNLLALMLAAVFIKFSLILAITARGYLLTARIITLFSLNVVPFIYTMLLGRYAGFHYLYFVFLTLPFLFFSIRKTFTIGFFVLLTLALFLFIRLNDRPPIS